MTFQQVLEMYAKGPTELSDGELLDLWQDLVLLTTYTYPEQQLIEMLEDVEEELTVRDSK